MVTATDATAPSSSRIGVPSISIETLRPSGTESTISSARTVSPVPSCRAMENSPRPISWPSARRNVATPSSSSIGRPGMRSPSTMRRASRLNDSGSPVRASNTTTPTGEVSTSASRSARARRSSRWLRALAMAAAAWPANSASTSSSSSVNSGAPSFPARKKWPTVSPRWRIGVPWKVFAGIGSGEKPSERTSAGRSVRRAGPGRSRRWANSFGPSGQSRNRRCSSSVKPEETKSRASPVSSTVVTMP